METLLQSFFALFFVQPSTYFRATLPCGMFGLAVVTGLGVEVVTFVSILLFVVMLHVFPLQPSVHAQTGPEPVTEQDALFSQGFSVQTVTLSLQSSPFQ